MKQVPGAVLVVDQRTVRQIAATIVEPLTLALAVSLGVLGLVGGWHAHAAATPSPTVGMPAPIARIQATAAAEEYVAALCRDDTAYLLRNTGESVGPMPWEPRLTDWATPCTRYRYLGTLTDRLGRDQFVFTLRRTEGTEVLYVLTFGHDGLVAGID